jgi:hypothetical protein
MLPQSHSSPNPSASQPRQLWKKAYQREEGEKAITPKPLHHLSRSNLQSYRRNRNTGEHAPDNMDIQGMILSKVGIF